MDYYTLIICLGLGFILACDMPGLVGVPDELHHGPGIYADTIKISLYA